jgi:DNA-binding IclR family transcriptional regulator
MHYQRVRQGRNLGAPEPQRQQGIARDTLDLLTIDGGWWTITELADRLRYNPESIRKALWWMRNRRLVASRPQPGSRKLEWRAA